MRDFWWWFWRDCSKIARPSSNSRPKYIHRTAAANSSARTPQRCHHTHLDSAPNERVRHQSELSVRAWRRADRYGSVWIGSERRPEWRKRRRWGCESRPLFCFGPAKVSIFSLKTIFRLFGARTTTRNHGTRFFISIGMACPLSFTSASFLSTRRLFDRCRAKWLPITVVTKQHLLLPLFSLDNMLQLSRTALGAAYLISFVRIPHCES